jgi:hypothetical protein
MEETTSANMFATFCHRVAYNFAQDPFFNKCQREKCRQNEKSDSSSFAELGCLNRMND